MPSTYSEGWLCLGKGGHKGEFPLPSPALPFARGTTRRSEGPGDEERLEVSSDGEAVK